MRIILSLAAIILLSGCALASLGKPRPETAIYTLKPQAITAAVTPPSAQNCGQETNLKITEPVAVAGLETHKIAVLQGAERYNYYTGARWAAPPAQMLQSVFVEAFEQSKAFNNVSSDMEAVDANLSLISEIRNFEVTEAATPAVHVRLMAKLVEVDTGKVLATIPVEKNIAPQNNTESIVAAFNQASSQAAAEIITTSAKALPMCKTKTAAPRKN